MVAYSRQISQARFSRELVYAKSSTSRWIASLSRKLSARWCPEGCYASAPLLRRPDPLAPVEESASRFPLACSSSLLYTPHAKPVVRSGQNRARDVDQDTAVTSETRDSLKPPSRPSGR
jgi:hypothetical protein